MHKIDLSQIKPISSLPRNYNSLVKETERKGAVVFLKRNKPVVVLISFPEWEELDDLRRDRDEKEAIETVLQSEKEFKAGKTKALRSLKDLA